MRGAAIFWTSGQLHRIANYRENGMTFADIAPLFGVKPEAVRKAHARALAAASRPAARRDGGKAWTDAEAAQAKTLWIAGHSASEIAQQLGRSRSAVCGKVYRFKEELAAEGVCSRAQSSTERRLSQIRGAIAAKRQVLSWPQDQVDQLARLWADGQTLAQVARAMDRTAGEIAAKIKRLRAAGMSFERRPRGPARQRPVAAPAPAALAARTKRVARADMISPQALDLMARPPGACCYPVGPASGMAQLFCCAPVADSNPARPYCAAHRARMFVAWNRSAASARKARA